MCLCVGLSSLSPLLFFLFLLRLGSALEIQEFSASQSSFFPIGGFHIINVLFLSLVKSQSCDIGTCEWTSSKRLGRVLDGQQVSAEGEGVEHKGQEREEEGAVSQHTKTSGLYLYLYRTGGWGAGVGHEKRKGRSIRWL